MNDGPRARGGERGLTLFEALIMLAVTALVGALLLPMTSSALTRNRARAEGALEIAASARTERVVRALMGAAVVDAGVDGDAQTIRFNADPDRETACAPLGARTLVTLSIFNGPDSARLICASAAQTVEIATWRGVAAFTYSADGVAWARAWRGAGALSEPDPNAIAPFVRLDTPNGTWIVRAGAPSEHPSEQ